jgi:hypothetical protein
MRAPLVLLALVTSVLGGCEYDVSGAAPASDDAGAQGGADGAPGAADADVSIDATPGAPDATPLPPDAATPLACPSGYTLDPVSGRAFRLGSFILDWGTAEGACADDGVGTHLAVIRDAAELARVAPIVAGNSVWLGVSDRVTEGEFLAVSGGPVTFLPWAPGEPNDDGLFGEDCVELKDGIYNDHGCGSLEYYLCECDGAGEDTGAF